MEEVREKFSSFITKSISGSEILRAFLMIFTASVMLTKSPSLVNLLSCFFMIDVYIDGERGRGMYDSYIRKVRPIVERFGGRYLVRTENVCSLSPSRNPQRIILIEFPDRDSLNACFSSEEYRAIAGERESSVDARAVIAEE